MTSSALIWILPVVWVVVVAAVVALCIACARADRTGDVVTTPDEPVRLDLPIEPRGLGAPRL